MGKTSIPKGCTFGTELGNGALGCPPSPFRPAGLGWLANGNQYTVQQVLGLDLAVGCLDFLYHALEYTRTSGNGNHRLE
jgi:hypothetical protein